MPARQHVVAKSPSHSREKRKKRQREGKRERDKEIAPHYIVINVGFRCYIGQKKRKRPVFCFPCSNAKLDPIACHCGLEIYARVIGHLYYGNVISEISRNRLELSQENIAIPLERKS